MGFKMAKGGRGRGSRRRDNRSTFSVGASPTTTASNDRRRRRGPPAIFITCEVGRERRCQREAIELIHHYYYNNNMKTAVLSSSTSPADDYDASLTKNETKLPDKDGSMQQQQIMQEEEEPTFSLEEELAMLRKGAAPEEVLSYFGNNNNASNNHNNESNSKRSQHTSTANGTCTQQVKRQKMNSSSMKSPFIVYDTGMRGTVCILCTIPQCELIPYDDILSTIRMLNNNNKDEKNNGSSSIVGSGISGVDADYGISTAIGNTNMNKRESTKDLTTTSVGVVVNGSSKLQDESKSILTPPLLWDPVETVRCIFHDTKKNATTTDDDDDDTDSNNDTDVNTNVVVKNANQGGRSSTIGMMNVFPPPGSRYITRMIPIQATVRKGVRQYLLLLLYFVTNIIYCDFFSLLVLCIN